MIWIPMAIGFAIGAAANEALKEPKPDHVITKEMQRLLCDCAICADRE